MGRAFRTAILLRAPQSANVESVFAVTVGGAAYDADMDSSDARIDYIEQQLPVDRPPRLGARVAEDGALIVPIHVAVVRHAAWEEWAVGAIWGRKTHWRGEIPLGLLSTGSIRRDVARALAAHDASELADLAANPGWEWVANAVPPLSWSPTADEDSLADPRQIAHRDDDGIRLHGPGPGSVGFDIGSGMEANPPVQEVSRHGGESRVTMVPPEACTVVEYRTTPSSGESARRTESVLVKDFERWLTAIGHNVQRYQIRPPGESTYIVTDTYDVTSGVLYEAKSKADRATIRLGIGQLLDYLRFVPEARGSLLLPSDPSYDLRSLIFACGLSVTYPQGSSWVTDDS